MTGSLPPYHIDVCDTARREPGMMVFNVRPGGRADNTVGSGWLLGVGQRGDIALNYSGGEPVQDNRRLPNGNVLFSETGIGRIYEITRNGDIVRHWYVAGKWRDKEPPDGGIPIDLPLTHHAINMLGNGNLLLMSAEVRSFDDWPGSETDPDAPTETANVVGDVICEVTPGGAVVNRWRILDMLDPYRMCYGSRSGYWRSRGFADSFDWCHANGTAEDPKDGGILVSLRTQDCIIKFDRASGGLMWILGTHDNWRPPWSEKLLEPVGDVGWQFHQHDCSVTPSGTVMCFDNGNHRATPFNPGIPPEENTSRAVEFRVDEDAMTVEQVWSYGDAPGERLYATYQCGAVRLPETGNTFITYGGIVTKDGVPHMDVETGFCRARLIEVTPDNEIVFDMWIEDTGSDPMPLSAFRAEHFPEA